MNISNFDSKDNNVLTNKKFDNDKDVLYEIDKKYQIRNCKYGPYILFYLKNKPIYVCIPESFDFKNLTEQDILTIIEKDKINNKKNNVLFMTNIDYNLIIENNRLIIHELTNYFKNSNKITIIGKSETAQYVKNAIGINQGLIFTNHKFLFMNDFESLFGIEQYINKIEFLFIPDFPHISQRANINFTCIDLIKYLKKFDFNGKIFIYQIQTSLNKGKLPKEYTFYEATSSNVAINFFHNIFNFNNFELYGIMKGIVYHPDLKLLNFEKPENYEDIFEKYMIYYNSQFNASDLKVPRKHNLTKYGVNISLN